MDDLQSSAEDLQHNMAQLEKVMEQFKQFPAQLAKLARKAEHDPAAREHLAKFHQAWNNGLAQNAEKLKKATMKMKAVSAEYKNSMLNPAFDIAAAVKSAEANINAAPTDTAPAPNAAENTPKRRRRTKHFV